MSWKLPLSIAAAFAEANKKWPKRSKISDGTIGDTAHAARKSDHNPDASGIVHAFDITHDPKAGVDCTKLADHLVQKKDARVKYIIWSKRIIESRDWTWKEYKGSNPHTKHMHVSIHSSATAEKDVSPWWDLALSREAVREQIIRSHLIIERPSWGARASGKLDPDWDYDSIVIHHSGNWGAKDPKEIEKEHLGNGSAGVGYHYMIHPDGRIFEGRSILYKGEHVAGANSHKIGVLMMGDYDEQWWDFDDELSKSHLDNLKRFIATLKKHFTGMKYLGGHLEFAAAHGMKRTCPGNLLMAQMDGLRKSSGLAKPK